MPPAGTLDALVTAPYRSAPIGPDPYNDEVTGSSPVTPTTLSLTCGPVHRAAAVASRVTPHDGLRATWSVSASSPPSSTSRTGADRGHPRRHGGVRRRPAQPPVGIHRRYPLQAVTGALSLAGGRRGDRGQPDGAHRLTA